MAVGSGRARSGLRLKLLVVVALRAGHRLCISVARDARSQLKLAGTRTTALPVVYWAGGTNHQAL